MPRFQINYIFKIYRGAIESKNMNTDEKHKINPLQKSIINIKIFPWKYLCHGVYLVNILTKELSPKILKLWILKLCQEEKSWLRFDLSATCNTHLAKVLKSLYFCITQKPGTLHLTMSGDGWWDGEGMRRLPLGKCGQR